LAHDRLRDIRVDCIGHPTAVVVQSPDTAWSRWLDVAAAFVTGRDQHIEALGILRFLTPHRRENWDEDVHAIPHSLGSATSLCAVGGLSTSSPFENPSTV